MTEKEKEELEKQAQSSAVAITTAVNMNIPFTGPLFIDPQYGVLSIVDYTPANIVIVPTNNKVPQQSDQAEIETVLSQLSTMNGIASFVMDGINNINTTFLDKFTDYIYGNTYNNWTRVKTITRSVGPALSALSLTITLKQINVSGVNINTGTDLILCCVSFFSGVGWVITGIYTLANLITLEVTGKTIPETIAEHKFWAKLNIWVNQLELSLKSLSDGYVIVQ